MSKIQVVAENVSLSEVNPRELTNDCHLVCRKGGVIDIVRAYKMGDIFDVYHDLGVELESIALSGGTLNPKNFQLVSRQP